MIVGFATLLDLEELIFDILNEVSLGPKVSETMKGKLSMGARILQAGGVERVFRQAFSVGEGERLLKAFQCYLSTTAGPIPGMLFISNEKIAFRSDRSLKLSSPKGGLVRVPYKVNLKAQSCLHVCFPSKVLVPLRRIKEAIPSQNMSKPNQKYIQLVTEDDFEFWFMGLVNCDATYRYLRQAISALQ
ncbi:hypothetical protein BHE74_00047039 [Ensete ventricosum]|nr:hypothetical protein GW17_00030158 [Ensete ventricosum]RWW47005.1 hypothetical protein BHE74_00047039 [Ensete ventricosum]RZS20600.1 hypothetical protein BHM03_00053132 [Ensete ventricosum]